MIEIDYYDFHTENVIGDESDLRCIAIWDWANAPECLKKESPHGGDEDWVALIPERLMGRPLFLDEGTNFGCCSVHTTKVRIGNYIYELRIGAHA